MPGGWVLCRLYFEESHAVSIFYGEECFHAGASRRAFEPPKMMKAGTGRLSWLPADDGDRHAGHAHAAARPWLLRSVGRLRSRLRTPVRRNAMLVDYVLGGIVTAGLLIYLTYALLRPERF